ncbi:MAG: M23 family metallopeptidase [Psychroflexus sp.]|uniref:M23 family metallopeptidase n=1 Tax=Psychroflexus sp. S27 TaxID=1982757 RepID=UPI000C29A026|nr:M23 family metallopeptidase [Psychroflexus sp. S27]PJX27537.1 peptidase M23 [Psychroflexus sp. S27]
MAKKKKTERKLSQKLIHKYRLVIFNENTFEEKISFKLTRLNVISLTALMTFLLITFTILLIAFTPLREYIPGYSSSALKEKATRLTMQVDSLESVVDRNNAYYKSIRKVLTGEVSDIDQQSDTILNTNNISPESVDFSASQEEKELRNEVEKKDKFNLLESAVRKTQMNLFPPVNGRISAEYDVDIKHYAVDIVTEKDTPIKATADGTVIFSDWTPNTGYVLIIEHSFGLISTYKHNAELIKSQGDLVKTGEVIAIAGNTGELTTGTHLHFELWVDGYPVDPRDYITFED